MHHCPAEDEEDAGAAGSSGSTAGTAGTLDIAAVAAAQAQGQAQGLGRPSWDGTSVRDEAAAAALGLTSRQASASTAPGGAAKRRADVAQTFKSIGGAFKGMAKDVASASKSQLKSLAGGGRQQQPLVTAVAGISDGACMHACARLACMLVLHAPAIFSGWALRVVAHRQPCAAAVPYMLSSCLVAAVVVVLVDGAS